MSIDKLPRPGDRKQRNLAEGGMPTYDESMLQRVEKLEQDLAEIKADVAVIKAVHATKSDVSDVKLAVIMWIISFIIVSQAALFALLKQLPQ